MKDWFACGGNHPHKGFMCERLLEHTGPCRATFRNPRKVVTWYSLRIEQPLAVLHVTDEELKEDNIVYSKQKFLSYKQASDDYIEQKISIVDLSDPDTYGDYVSFDEDGTPIIKVGR